MNVFFKSKRSTTPSECTPKVRKRLESAGKESPISKIASKMERAEKNRISILENRVRALSDADELRLEKVDALKLEDGKTATKIQHRQCRAAKNRHRLLSQRSQRLKRKHSLISNQLSDRKDQEIEARHQLFTVFERRGREAAHKREEHYKHIAKRAKETNPTKEQEDKKSELLVQWEEKIERARKKRQELLQKKVAH
eukprot:CAMPEP_0205819900 /NCGR_PEP_ID=MMETSP0206-20130828/2405_1 /ASSEMBLY_ACC=CAM_ASM_000279 /TAXON_ID=36767 /ORGANISM="Euplotes focardii, Strain TN1" /LENGTH=197 /DNA_ID=CAMNT_0053113991 /DNA_START=99 /DNA_END=692 /DNA_ORIENTATION=+